MNPQRTASPSASTRRHGRSFAASVERASAAVARAVQQSSRNLAWLVRAR